MTSRDGWQIEFTDPVDVMIRWVLREDAADGSPPPEVWERVRDRLMRQASDHEGVGSWRGFRIVARVLAVWCLERPTSARVPVPYDVLALSGVRQGELFYLADQYGTLLRRLAVV